MTVKELEAQLTKMESAIDSILLRLEAVEKKLEPVDNLSKAVEETRNKQLIHEISVEDKMKDVSSETDIKIETSELRSEEKIRTLGEKFKETVEKIVAIEQKAKEWPTPAEGWTLITNKRSKDRKVSLSSKESVKVSHAEKFKDKPKDTIVILGDSWSLKTRGVSTHNAWSGSKARIAEQYGVNNLFTRNAH